MGDKLISVAKELYSKGCYDKAVKSYMYAFETLPQLKALHEPEFRAALNRLNEVLACSDNKQEIFHIFARAINIFPDNVHLLNDTGKYLYKFGYYLEAWCQFQRALKIDAGFVNAERNLNSVKNLLVERWHFRMLNDYVRNTAYQTAITASLVPFVDTVLDLGSGTGIFTLYAVKCAPLMITACDNSEQMAKISVCVLEDNGIDDVNIVKKNIDDITEHDIGGKKSMIITELFDAGLFGEHVLPALKVVHNELLAKSGKIIPYKAKFSVIGAKSHELNLRYKLRAEAKELLNIPQTMHVHKYAHTAYDCEDVNLFKDLTYMTCANSLIKINFNDYNDVNNKLQDTEPYSVKLEFVKDGEVDVLIGFFKLYLTPNKLVTITTCPFQEGRANAWQQTVFYDFLPQTDVEGASINQEFELKEDALKLVPKTNSPINRASGAVIRFLNDTEYLNAITKCLGMASVYLGQIADMSEIKLVDMCPFPLFGLLMLKRGAKSLTCCAQRPIDEEFFRSVFKLNNIPASKVKVLVGDEWTQEVFEDEKYHAVFCNVLDTCGDLNLRMYEISQLLRNAHLLPNGLFMPANITLMGQVVSSHWLDVNNRLDDKNVSGFGIAKYINKYQVSQCFHVYLTRIEYTALTDPVDLGKHGHVVSGVENAPIIASGDANGILCWYNIELMEDLGEISTRRNNAFIDGTAFLANPAIKMQVGGIANILRCVDADGAFKLILDVEAT